MLKRSAIFLLCVFTVVQWGSAATIHAKAILAQWLIASAWQKSLQLVQGSQYTEAKIKPWNWADTWPVARLRWVQFKADKSNERVLAETFVLAGAQGNSLAFGPGHVNGTALPGIGASVIGGHRDTHFAFLKNVIKGDYLKVQTQSGVWHTYQIIAVDIVNTTNTELRIDKSADELWLVTCYPFNALLAGGSLRYVARAEKVYF